MEHPGLELARKIKASGFRQANIAQQIGVPPTSFNEMLHGKRLLTAEACFKMQVAMGYGRELWRKQSEYLWSQVGAGAAAVELGEWISVAVELPAPNSQVWAAFLHHGVRQEVRRAFFRPEGFWDEFLGDSITHWQPLYVPQPSPPPLLAATPTKEGAPSK